MSIRKCSLILVLVCLTAGLAQSATYTLPVPELTGGYAPGVFRTTTVDFGVSFQSIQSVSISWSGSVTAGWMSGQPEGGRLYSWFRLQSKSAMSGWYGEATYPNPESFSRTDVYTGGGNWDFLLDGAAELGLQGDSIVGPDPLPQDYVPYSASLSSASLVVNATPIPEPSGILALTAGLAPMGLAIKKRLTK